MRKTLLLAIFVLTSTTLFAQYRAIKEDIFGNLIYENEQGNYEASLKKDIFKNLIFTDSRNNNITLEKKYLERVYPEIQANEHMKMDVFYKLISQSRHVRNYVGKYKIDIFDKLVVEDNQGYKLEEGTDIFGNDHFQEEIDGVKTSMKKTLNGTLEFVSGSNTASLRKDIFNKWTYKDSFGNEIQFADKTWKLLVTRWRTDEGVFGFLIDQFFYVE